MSTTKKLLLAGLLAAGLVPIATTTSSAAPSAAGCRGKELTTELGASDIEEGTDVAFDTVGTGDDRVFGASATATFKLGIDPTEASCSGITYRATITPISLSGAPAGAPFVNAVQGDGSNPLLVHVDMPSVAGWDRICVTVELETLNLKRELLLDSGTDGNGNIVCADTGQGYNYR